jgi:Ca2+-binding RTX toxin-like protein
VVVHTRGGDDTLTYTLTNPLTSPLNLQIDMGSGNDTATLDFSPGITNTRLKVDFTGGKGNDTLTTKFGAITNSELYFRSNLGKGNDTFDNTLLGSIVGDSAVRFLVHGGKGADTLGFHADSTNIDSGAKLDVNLLGGKGNDTINVDYQGVLNGELRLNANGGPGDDTVNANLTLNAGSSGELRGQVRGGPGNDTLTFNVFDNSGGTADVDAFIDGGPGADTITHTPNVKVKR